MFLKVFSKNFSRNFFQCVLFSISQKLFDRKIYNPLREISLRILNDNIIEAMKKRTKYVYYYIKTHREKNLDKRFTTFLGIPLAHLSPISFAVSNTFNGVFKISFVCNLNNSSLFA